MRLPRGLCVVRSQHIWVGYDQRVTINGQENRTWLRRYIFYVGDTQKPNGCRRTTMTKTQRPPHSRGSGWYYEQRLPSGVPRVYELCIFSCVVGCNRLESVCCDGCYYSLSSSTARFKVEDRQFSGGGGGRYFECRLE